MNLSHIRHRSRRNHTRPSVRANNAVPIFGEFDDSPFWGTRQLLNIKSGVNSKDTAYHKAYKIFLVRLVEARKQAGLTQVDVAKRLGKAHSFISKCELGERRVDFVELQRLAKLYNKDLSFFCE